jgi:hypothetical protein
MTNGFMTFYDVNSLGQYMNFQFMTLAELSCFCIISVFLKQ